MEIKTAQQPENVLEKFGKNITKEIATNNPDPVIGREDEIKRLIEIISRKTKNNPCLIGEPGVGKTAIVEGFAQRIVNNEVPENLKGKEVYELSLTSLIAGASYQGEFERRLNEIIKQVEASDGKVILFIDEIHQLVGAGKSGGAMDAANILKPAMARGKIRVIGATTLKEYRQYIEKDGALERRIQKINVSEPSIQEAITIMRGLKERWELFHKVKIHDSALIAAVELSDRYITDRFLPDKAIDLVDEAAAKIKTEMTSMPVALDKINREIIHKQTEKASLINEKDQKSKNRLQVLDEELAKLNEEKKVHNDIWMKHKKDHDDLIQLKANAESFRLKAEKLQSEGEFEKASKLLYVQIPKVQLQIEDLENKINDGNKLIKDAVTPLEIAEIISSTTGIPVSKLTTDEKERLLNLNEEIKSIVKGQEEAVEIVSNAILRSRAGISDPNRPIGSFLFLGSTGVGKTFLAKTLAKSLFNTEKALIRIDMSEYMEQHSVSKLLGAPPGYIGHGEAGVFEEVRRKPYSVVLFDEIEKAHVKVLDILLQVLDDGFVKDSEGRKINFKNTLIILTSNIGSAEILENKRNEAIEELKKYLRPEFVNRIDELVIFNPIDSTTINKIIIQNLDNLSSRLDEKDYHIQFSSKIVEHIAKDGYEPNYGARPIKRYIQKNIENELATMILKNEIIKNEKYELTINKDGKYIINKLAA